MPNLRGFTDVELNKIAEKAVQQAFDESYLPGLISPPTFFGGITSSMREVEEFLFELKYSFITGRENVYVLTNGAIVCAGVYTGGVSASYCRYTNNPIARAYYFTSTIFSLSAIINGGMATAARTCRISEAAVLSEALGYGFMRAAKQAHRVGLEVEGKPVPPFLLSKKEIMRLPKFNNGNIAFLSPAAGSGFEGISLTQIIVVGTTIFSIYRTAKLVTNGYKRIYQYVKQKSTPKLDPQQSVWFVSEYLIEYFSIDRVYRIYYVALQL